MKFIRRALTIVIDPPVRSLKAAELKSLWVEQGHQSDGLHQLICGSCDASKLDNFLNEALLLLRR